MASTTHLDSCSEFDHSGVQLIEREEEVCIFYEKVNVQEKIKLHQDVEIHILEEKIRFLKLRIAEKQRQISVTRKLVPIKKSLDADLAVIQIQVGERPGDTSSGRWLGSWPLGVYSGNGFLNGSQAALLVITSLLLCLKMDLNIAPGWGF